jgi:DNA-directed RNA polymerase subunit L
VILVSPAPIYGIKLIETIQRIFTFFGKALMVDAENWMAHKGTANVILNILRHPKTPQNFFILSGDVHYSFVSDVKLRFRKSQPNLVQFTASGIKNTFPEKLIHILDRMNQILYARYSPLNWLTQRRFMSVRYRRPEKHSGRQLLNRSGIGVISLNEDHSDIECKIIDSTNQSVYFFRKK